MFNCNNVLTTMNNKVQLFMLLKLNKDGRFTTQNIQQMKYIYTYMHTCTHIHTYIYIHIHIHTQTYIGLHT